MTETVPAIGDVARVTSTGLEFRGKPTFEQWLDVGRRLGRITNASCWWIADWAFHGDGTYGRKYEQAIRETGLDYGTLRNYASVAGRFDLSRRRDTLSFHHHAEVASLNEADQDLWLNRAEQEHWSHKELREQLRTLRSLPSPAAIAAARNGGYTLIYLRVSPFLIDELVAGVKASRLEFVPKDDGTYELVIHRSKAEQPGV